MKRLTAVFLIALFLGQQGCAVWKPLPVKGKEHPPLPPEYETYYEYPRKSQPNTVLREEKRTGYILRTVEIPFELPQDLRPAGLEQLKAEAEALRERDRKKADDLKLQYMIRMDVYLPKDHREDEKKPAILISPILGGNMVVDLFAKFYAWQGYTAVIVHRKRPALEDGAKDLSGLEDYMRSSVIRLRQALDWLIEQPYVDSGRIGAFGVSYGAILHTVLAAVEPRIRYHVLAMPAGPLHDVIFYCPDRIITKLMDKARNEFGWPDEKIHQELREHIKTDPFYLAPYVPKRKVQMYAAVFDRVVGANRSLALWREMGRPELKLMPFGHYGGVLIFPYLQLQSYLSFRRHLT